MPYSTCCGAHTDFDEIGICPDCLEHCDWEDEEEIEEREAAEQAENQIEQNKLNAL